MVSNSDTYGQFTWGKSPTRTTTIPLPFPDAAVAMGAQPVVAQAPGVQLLGIA